MRNTLRFRLGLMACVFVFGTSALHAAWIEDGVPLCTEAAYQLQPAITPVGNGGAIVVWWDYRNGEEPDIFAQRVDADGNALWAAGGVPVCVQPGDQYAAAIVSDGAGGAIIAWHDSRSGYAQWDIYAQHVDGNGSPLWAVDGILVCGAGQYQTNPQIVIDEHHGAIIAWEDERGYVATDIYAQRVSGAGALLWAANGVPVCTYTGVQENFQMAPDDSGGVYFTWQDARTGGSDYWDIYAQRLNDAGSRRWILNGYRVCGAADDQQWPSIVADDAGVIIAWSDSRNAGDYDIYAQRVDPTGHNAWAFDGVSLCSVAANQYDPRLASDGEHGAIVAWRDYGAPDSDIFAQRVGADGSCLWPAGGIAISDAIGDQLTPRILADGVGGAILAWEDRRIGTGEEDIYAQRVSGNGQTLWEEDGKVLCAAAYGQRHPCAAPDGSEGAIVAWADGRRNGDWDIYAQSTEFDPSGAVGDVGLGPDRIWLRNNPNPFGASTSLSFGLEAACDVTLEIHDAAGRLVRTIASGPRDAGPARLVWDARDQDGRDVPDGAYFCRMRGAGMEVVRKAIRAR